MLIDGYTVLAQVINFLILAWLLKLFLYRPVLDAIDKRRKEIESQLQEAAKSKEEAASERKLFEDKKEQFDRESGDKRRALDEEIDDLRTRLFSQARREVDEQQKKWYSRLNSEKEEVCRDLRLQVQKEVFSIARKSLKEIAGVKLEEYVIESLLRRLKDFVSKEKETLHHFVQPSNHLVIRTAFDLSDAFRQKTKGAVSEAFDKPFEVTFVSSPDLLAGVELVANGQKVSWNVAEYLSSLESCVGRVKVGKPGMTHEQR